MPKTTYTSVDDYLASQPGQARATLTRVRDAIRKAIASAEETISYQIPTYKVDGVAAIYFAGWKEHFSIYPVTRTMLADLGDDLAPYTIAKGTIRFELSDPVPVRLISRIARHRAKEAAAKLHATTDGSRRARAKQTRAKRGER